MQSPLPIPQPLELSLYGGVYPCPLSFELSFSTVPAGSSRSSLGVRSALGFLTGSSSRLGSVKAPAALRLSDSSRRLRSCRSFHGSNIHELQPVKTLGGSPFEKSAVYIKAACPRFHSIYSQKLKGRGLYIPLFLCQKRGVF